MNIQEWSKTRLCCATPHSVMILSLAAISSVTSKSCRGLISEKGLSVPFFDREFSECNRVIYWLEQATDAETTDGNETAAQAFFEYGRGQRQENEDTKNAPPLEMSTARN